MKKKSKKIDNQIHIITLIKNEGSLSRKVIAEKLALTRASITNLTNELIDAGILVESGELEEKLSRAGRKEILIDLNEDYWYLLGIDIEINTISIGICTLRGRTIERINFKFDTLSNELNKLSELQKMITEKIHYLLKKTSIDEKKIFYAGIAMVGRKSYYIQNRLEIPPILNKRRELLSYLEEKFAFSFSMENNVRALALIESQFYLDTKKESYLYIKVGPGLGSAIVFFNSLYRGVTGQAGEIGRSIVTDFYSPQSNSKIITLEEIVSLDFLKNEIKPYWNSENFPYMYQDVKGDFDKLTMKNIYSALECSEPLIEKFYRKKMRILALRIYDYKYLLDLDRIYLFFSISASSILYKYLIFELQKLSPELAEITKMSKTDKVDLYLGGAASGSLEGFKHLNTID